MKIKSDLIPHNQFHKGLWLQTEKSPWYFFYETPREYHLPKSNSFYKTVDESLLDLVKLFHSKSIPTTPSCSGHIQPLMHYAKLFNTIKSAQNDIRNNGVELMNPETNRKFFYKNPNYSLPWNKEEFLLNMENYQKKGVLGFIDKDDLHEKLNNLTPVEHDNGVTLILTNSNDEESISKNWDEIYKMVKSNLK